MLGSLIVTQCRQCGDARAGTTRRDVAGEDVGRARAQPELLAQPPRVGEVVQRDHGRQAARRCTWRGSRRSAPARPGRTRRRRGSRRAHSTERRKALQPRPAARSSASSGWRQKSQATPERSARPVASQPGPVVVRLAVAVEAALDLVARGRHPGEETVAEQAGWRGCAEPAPGRARSGAAAWRRASVQLGRRGGRPSGPGADGSVRLASERRRDTAADTMSTSSRACRTSERTWGSVASLPAPRAAACTSRAARDHLGHLVAHRLGARRRRAGGARGATARRARRRRVRSERQTDGSSATGASWDAAWATAISASSTAIHMRRRTRAAVPWLSCSGVARADAALPAGGQEGQPWPATPRVDDVAAHQTPVAAHVAASDQEGDGQAQRRRRGPRRAGTPARVPRRSRQAILGADMPENPAVPLS